jgi:predicted PurR-regulated permease PerM
MIINLLFAVITSSIVFYILKLKMKKKTLACFIASLLLLLVLCSPSILFICTGDSPPENSINFNENSIQQLPTQSREKLSNLVMLGIDTEFLQEDHDLLITWVSKGMKSGLSDSEFNSVNGLVSKGVTFGLEANEYEKLIKLIKKGVFSGEN